MFTRKQYLAKDCTYRQYHAQFVTDFERRQVLKIIGKERILASEERMFNDIPMELWDSVELSLKCFSLMAEARDFLSDTGRVRIAKEVAQQIKDEEMKSADVEAGPTYRDDTLVTRSAPQWAWEVIDQCLELDSTSNAADRQTRESVREAYEAMIEACEYPD